MHEEGVLVKKTGLKLKLSMLRERCAFLRFFFPLFFVILRITRLVRTGAKHSEDICLRKYFAINTHQLNSFCSTGSAVSSNGTEVNVIYLIF